MNFRKIDLRSALIFLGIALVFPVYKYLSAEGDKMLPFIDGATIIGLVFVIIGVFYSFILRGDLDVTEYFTKRVVQRGIKPFKAFLSDKNEEREGRFNYPLFTGILLLLISGILTLIFY